MHPHETERDGAKERLAISRRHANRVYRVGSGRSGARLLDCTLASLAIFAIFRWVIVRRVALYHDNAGVPNDPQGLIEAARAPRDARAG